MDLFTLTGSIEYPTVARGSWPEGQTESPDTQSLVTRWALEQPAAKKQLEWIIWSLLLLCGGWRQWWWLCCGSDMEFICMARI